MAVQRLNLTRDQLASFLQDFEQIKQFERLFSTVDTINTVTLDEISVSAGNAFAAANEALAQISGISTALDSLLLAPRNELGTISAQNADNVNITGGLISGLDAPLPVASGGTGQTSYTDGQLLIGNTTGNTLAKATLTAGTGIAITNGSGSITIAATGGTGTVTSVGLSGGTTGLTATSDTTNPITTSGTFTIGGTLVVANGGTGATNATDARTNLVAAKSGANSDITSMSGITGGISLVDNIDFDTTAVVAGAVGRLVWNDGDGTLDLGLKGGNVTLQVGQEEVQRSFNEAGVPIVEGNVIYVSGAQGNRIAVSIAKANAAATSLGTIGMATENIANGAEGFITTQGLVRKLNTILDSEGNALAEGDLLYLSATVLGGYTKIRPDTPNFHVFVGYVVRVHATVGSIFIRPNVYPSLDEINGIKIVSTASGNTLIYDAVAGYYKTNTLTAGTNVSISNGPGTITINATDQFVGTVTSVGLSGGTTGLTISSSSTNPITTAGTFTIGGTLAAVNGGTGQSVYAIGDLLYASTTTALSRLADVATGNALISGGVGVAPSYGKIGLTTHVSGTLPVANGGTGVTSSTGTVAVVLSNTPTLVTPILGNATATTIANGLGTVGNPSFTFTGDLNTGMWSPAADTTAFSTAGIERARIDNSGNFGVGTTSPTTGSISNTAILNAGLFTTLKGSVSSGSGVVTTLTTVPTSSIAVYVVSCGASGASDPTNYTAVALVSVDSTVLRLTSLQTAPNMIISVSGQNIRAAQSSGITLTILYSLTRIA